MVVAIIAVLAAMLLPALRNAREQARGSTCMNNLRQMGQGVYMYLQDYADTFPRYAGNPANTTDYPDPPYQIYAQTGVAAMVMPYVKDKNLAMCPKTRYRPNDLYIANYGVTRILPFAYQDEGWVPIEWKRHKRLQECTNPDRRMMIYDCGLMGFYKGDEAALGVGWASYIPGYPGNTGPNNYLDAFQKDLYSPRHGAVNMVVFVDGHAEAMTPLKMVNDTVFVYP